jgi:diguanylate cyclase (GGDEF)-like protein
MAHRKSPAMNIVDYFIHPSLHAEPDIFSRARILAASILTLIVGALTALVAILLSGFPRHSNLLASFLILPAVVCFGYALARLRNQSDYRFASQFAIIVMLAIMTGGVCVSGGPLVSPALQLLIIPPLTAYFFGGRPLGGGIVIITTLIVMTLIALSAVGVDFPQTVEAADKLNILSFVVSFLNLAVVSAMAFIYEYTAAVLKRERDLEHEKFIQLAKTDPLTGLSNRRNFDAMLVERMNVYGPQNQLQRFALGYLDLDGFKPINDRYGHAIGDEVLRVVSDRLRNTLRGSDFVGRHGGDEFMLMIDLPGSQDFLETMAERLLNAIAQPIPTNAGIVGVTGSLGFAIFPLDASEIEELKKSADSAMYAAKRQRGSWRYFRQDQ